MKFKILFIFLSVIIAGFTINPVFVIAKTNCYVDKSAEDDGDGSSDEPYKKISKALDKGCKKITVEKGIYKDPITLGSGVKIIGKSRDGVVITGKIKMKDNSELDKVTVSGSGIDVDKGADVDVENSKIKDAHIGIKTLGNGTLTVEDTSFSGNRKAFYLQRGKNVKITGCKVYNNSEEGIDIRSNVDGVISHNEIYSNGESGIEVILGKSDLRIENNSIKKNRASGIATQYYKEASKLGGVKIIGNTITGNKDYGINCKIPSGGSPAADYWSNSIGMHSNKISDNKDGNFSETCHFDKDMTSNANKTKQQMEQEQKEIEELKGEKEKQQKTIEEKEKQEAQEKEEKEKQAQEELEQKKVEEINTMISHMNFVNADIEKQNQQIQKRPAILAMIIGPNYTALHNMYKSIEEYDNNIANIQKAVEEVSNEEKKEQLQNETEQLQQKKNNFIIKIQEYNNTFSVYKWLLEILQ